jgi:hypothetical protein
MRIIQKNILGILVNPVQDALILEKRLDKITLSRKMIQKFII